MSERWTGAQLDEVKKAFSVFDRDGSGKISPNELAELLRNLSGHMPSKQEVGELMKRMDSDHDGEISWDEFSAALEGWVGDGGGDVKQSQRTGQSSASSSPSKKRKAPEAPSSPRETRAKIHKRIASFFLQFEKSHNFEQIRNQFFEAQQQRQNGVAGDDAKHDAIVYSTIMSSTDAKEKFEAIARVEGLMVHMQEIAQGINQVTEPQVALNSVEALANILSLCEVFPSPEDRYEMGDLFIQIFTRIMEASVMPRVIDFLKADCLEGSEVSELRYRLQYEAARVVTYFAPGPRIAHTPTDSVLHPDRTMHKDFLVKNGAAHYLGELLTSGCMEVREQALLALGMLARHDAPVRDFLLDLGIYEAILELINDQTGLTMLKHATWAVAIFCGSTHDPSSPPNFQRVGLALPKLAHLFFREEEVVLVNVLTALGFLLPGIEVERNIIARVVSLLGSQVLQLQLAAAQLLLDIFAYRNEQSVVFMLESNLLEGLKYISASSNASLQRTAVEIMGFVVDVGYAKQAMEAKLVPSLILVLKNSELARNAAAHVINVLTRGVLQQSVQLLVEDDLVRDVMQSLRFFKDYDPVLRDMYHFVGPMYNFDLLECLVGVLINIRSALTQEQVVRYFDLGSIDALEQVMKTLSEELTEQMDAWRTDDATKSSTLPLEGQVKALLVGVRECYVRENKPEYVQILKRVDKCVRDFDNNLRRNRAAVERKKMTSSQNNAFSPSSSSSSSLQSFNYNANYNLSGSSGSVQLKCFFDGDNRVIDVPRTVKLSQLKMDVQLKYGRSLILQYQDREGDRLTIDSDDVLARAFQEWARDNSAKLYLAGRGGNRGGKNGGSFLDLGGGNYSHNKFSGGAFSSNDFKENNNNSVRQLLKQTRFSKNELENLHNTFRENADDSGEVNLDAFSAGLRSIGMNDDQQIEQLFHAFDTHKQGTVNFKNFAVGISMWAHGNMEDRLKLAFSAYDLDGSNSIDRFELFQLLQVSLSSDGNNYRTDQEINGMVDECFRVADKNNDNKLDFKEFKQAISRHQIVVQGFWGENLNPKSGHNNNNKGDSNNYNYNISNKGSRFNKKHNKHHRNNNRNKGNNRRQYYY